MHSTQPLPFPLYFDSSMLATAGQCQRQFFLRYMRHLAPKTESVHLIAGGAFASGVETTRRAFYLSHKPLKAAVADGIRTVVEQWGDFVPPDDSTKTLLSVCEALFAYFHEWYNPGDDALQPYRWPNGDISVEMTFALPLSVAHPESGEAILYVGRPDFLGIWGDNNLTMLCDEKTTTRLGATWSRNWDLRGQFIGYTWAAQEALNIDIAGILVRGVAFKKYDLETLQVPILVPKWLIEQWFERTNALVEDLVRAWKAQYWRPDFDQACTSYGGCSYTELCLRRDPEPWIALDYEEHKWDPIGSNTQ